MIVIAIIGILAAVLYPAMTGYFERSRDTNRSGAMNQVALALSTYFVDKETYPDANSDLCLNAVDGGTEPNKKLSPQYIKTLPKDPKNGNNAATGNCTSGYGYKRIHAGNTSAGDAGYIAFAKMEKAANGNMLLTDAQTQVTNYEKAVEKTDVRSEMSKQTDGTTAFAVYNQ